MGETGRGRAGEEQQRKHKQASLWGAHRDRDVKTLEEELDRLSALALLRKILRHVLVGGVHNAELGSSCGVLRSGEVILFGADGAPSRPTFPH